MSDSPLRETAGFFCRWALLAGAGTFVALVAAAGLTATAGIAEDVRSRLVLKDWVAAPAKASSDGITLRGYLVPPISRPGLDVGLVAVAGRPLGQLQTDAGGCILRYGNPQPGVVTIEARGMPYGSLAFERGRCRLLCVPADRRVFLVDARLLCAPGAGASAGFWDALLNELDAAASVALFHTGPRDAFLDSARALREAGVARPVLFDDQYPWPAYTVQRASGTLGRGRSGAGMEIVTHDGELAIALAKQGFSTHRIGPGAGPRHPPATLKQYPSPAAFRERFPR